MLSYVYFLLIFALCGTGSAQPRSHFISPPDAGQPLIFNENIVLTVGSTLQANWSTTLSQYSVYLWQQSLTIGSAVLGSPVYTKILGGHEPGGFKWTISQQAFDLSQSNVFFFALGPTEDITSNTMTSHYFNLTTDQAAASSTSSVSGVSSTTSPSTSTNSASNSDTNASKTSSTSAAGDATKDGSNSAATLKIGLGVGIPMGVLILLLGLYLLVVLHRLRQRDSKPANSPPSNSYPILLDTDKHKSIPQEIQAPDRQYHAASSRNNKRLTDHDVIAELSGDGARRI